MFLKTTVGEPLLISRLEAACAAAEAAGVALMAVRGHQAGGREADHGQLKTAMDETSEELVLGYLQSHYPADRFLCEERFTKSGQMWDAPPTFWTVDALDGTRSFVEGFDGFCVQVAYVQDGRVRFGVVHEPMRRVTYWALEGYGAYRDSAEGRKRLALAPITDWPEQPVFIDSTRPAGTVGEVLSSRHGAWLECGSIGLKICRVAEGTAHVFAKALTFKVWDTAPGERIVDEAGGRMGLWCGAPIPYNGTCVQFENLVATPKGLFEETIRCLREATPR